MANLLTYQDVSDLCKAYLSAADGAKVDALIGEVEAWIKSSILNWTAETAVAHSFDGQDSAFLYLGRWLRTATAITIDGEAVDAADVVNRGYVLILKSSAWPRGWGNVEVTGDWGFVLSPANPADTISEFKLLEGILLRQVLTDYFQPEATSENVGGMSFNYMDQLNLAISQSMLARNLMAKYRGPSVA